MTPHCSTEQAWRIQPSSRVISFRAAELRTLLEDHGLVVEALVGLEGIASNFESALEGASPGAVSMIEQVVRDQAVREDPTVADISNHILAVAYPADR